MKSIKDVRIKNKLIAIILSITLLTLTIGFASIIIYNKLSMQKSFINEVDTMADIIGSGMIGPLSFDDKKTGEEELTKWLKITPAIRNVWVYDENDKLFVSYYHDKSYEIPVSEVISTPITELSSNYLHISRPIEHQKVRLGTIYLMVSTKDLDKLTRNLIMGMILIILLLIPVSLILAARLQRIISRPILDLVEVTKKVSAEGNYSLRAKATYKDELGMLVKGFNDMMEQIHNRDIHRDRVENELKAAEFFLSSVMASMPSILISIDPAGNVTHWNKSTVELTGIEANEAIGKNLWKLLPGFIKFKQITNHVSHIKKSMGFYKELIKIKGNTFYLNVTLFPLPDSRSPKFVLMAHNVTDIEIKEQQLRQSQKMETVGTLAGGLAHDFNNVLGGIIGTISLYKYKISKKRPVTQKEIEKYFNMIEESANRASDMVQHLLSLTRRHELSFAPTDLNGIIEHTVKICNNTFDKSIEIGAAYSRGMAMTNADPTQLEQCLLNLCINAAHAMTIMRKEGDKYGGSLNISLERVKTDKYFFKLHPETGEEEDYWVISVQDTGIGMKPQIVTKIFDPFFTTKEDGEGTGLGLAMVYNIIKQHKGFIDVYSQEGIGTTFYVYLPILEHKIEDKIHPAEEKIPGGEGLILVVDDEEIMRQTAKSILEECGYEVILAENGEEAVNIYRTEHQNIKAVLLDMVMPKMSGKQAFIELTKINKDVKTLLASGFKKDSRVESILELGVKGFIQKPYGLVKLATSMNNVINS
ncbi:MAG: ATP-binding protein [Candidatus Aminicenantes bacterium]|jgi:PAS domain S-box-containing protein